MHTDNVTDSNPNVTDSNPPAVRPAPAVKLDVGSGGRPAPHLGAGWLGVDAFTPADVRAVMWQLPFGDGTVDEIFSSHALEHVGKRQVVPTLREWRRVLKPGGRITLRVPNLEWCCRHWLEHQNTGWDLDVIFGGQQHEGGDHKTGFTEAILRGYVAEAGLRVTGFETLQTHGQKTLSVECTC